MAEKRKRYEPSIKVALREQATRNYALEEDLLDSPDDYEVIREFGGKVDHDNDRE